MIDRYTITLLSLVFGILHFCVAVMGSLALVRTARNLHKNHKLLLINLLIGCYMSSTGTLTSSMLRIFMLTYNQFSLQTTIVFRTLNMFESLGPNIFRLTFIAFTIERAVATRRIYSYELSSPILGYILMPLSLICAFSMSFSYNIYSSVNASITLLYAIYISLDTLSLAATLILIALNQKWQSIENISSYYNLSMRYQIFENIRILLFLVRIIALGFTAALLATISSLTIRKLHFTHYTYYARVLYFGIWNIYGLFAGLLLIYELYPALFMCGPLKKKHKYGLIPSDVMVLTNSDRYFIRLNSSWSKKAQAMNL